MILMGVSHANNFKDMEYGVWNGMSSAAAELAGMSAPFSSLNA